MFALDASQIDATWQDYEALLQRFERQTGDMSAEHVKACAKDATLQIWGLQDDQKVHGITLTEIVTTPRGLICIIRGAVGDAPTHLQAGLLDEIGSWAKAQGCVAVQLIGRRGWLRRFPRFRQRAVVAEWNLRAH